MKQYQFYTLSLTTLLLLNGCGGTSSEKISSKEPSTITKKEKRTLNISVLGTSQEWQKDPVEKNWIDAVEYCQSLTLEGQSDWRLPSSKEFFALLDNNRSIDEQFPKISSIKEFWTSSETSFDTTKAWKIATWSNSEAYKDKKSVLGVRCVRGDKFPRHDFSLQDDSLKDIDPTGKELHWQDDKTSSLVLLNFEDAQKYCKAKSKRVPTIFELQNIIEKESLDTPFKYIKDNDFSSYWSQTAQPMDQNQILTLNFTTGGVTFNQKDALNHIKCVEQINHAPDVTVDQSLIVDEDNKAELTLTGTDIDGDQLSVIITQYPEFGKYENNIYTPSANFNGTDTIKYRVSDGNLTSQEATVTIVVNPINDIPTTSNLSITTVEDGKKDFIIPAVDIDNDPITFIIESDLSYGGTLTHVGDKFTYISDTNFQGRDSFTFKVFDGTSYSEIKTVTIDVTGVNDAPVANSQTLNLQEDSSKSILLTADDMDGDDLSYMIISGPSNGTLSGTAPNLIYTPNNNFNSTDSFTFRVSDGKVDSNIATINLNISSQNDAPVANNLNISTDKNSDKSITLLASDIDNSTLTYHIRSNPTHGTLSGTAPNLIYTPNLDYAGVDSFTYYANDGTTDSNDATVNITIDSNNNAPTADPKTVSTDEDRNLTITLSGNDPDQDTLTYIITKQPNNGTLIKDFNVITYKPNPNYSGSDNFEYKVNDGELDSQTAAVNITINAINDKPVATDINIETDEDTIKDFSLSGSDIENSTLNYIVNDPSHGTLTGSGKDRTYTPNANYTGTDSFTYKVNDGALDSNIATVTIRVIEKNDAPTANSQNITLNEDENKTITLTADDIDLDTLRYEIVTQPKFGSLSSIDKNSTVYTPEANYNGDDSFTFRVYDGSLYSQEATVTLNIKSVNDLPVASELSDIITAEDTPVAIKLLANDDDNDTLTYIYTDPLHGILSGDAPNLTYTPDNDYNGEDSFEFYVKDGISNSNTILVNISVESVNDAPTAYAGEDISANQGELVTLSADGSRDSDGTIISYKWFENDQLLSDQISFSKDDFTIGTHNISLQIEDDKGEFATDEIKVTIHAPSQMTFTPHSVTTKIKNSEWLEMVDLDKDGDLDILSASSKGGSTKISWYTNNGNNTFTQHKIVNNANSPESIKAADINGDGYLDILYTTYEDGASLMKCLNDGTDNFPTCSALSSATNALTYITLADIDKDGNQDIISASWGQNRIDWYKGNADGTFSNPILIDNSNMTNAISLDTIDLDKDGDMDIVAAANGENRVDWYENDGTGNFTPHFIDDTISGIYSVVFADINSDGYEDIITTANKTGKIYWHDNSKTQTPNFTPNALPSTLNNLYYASAADMDNDGDLDIISASSETGGKIVWYENSDTNFIEHLVATNVDNIIRVFPADMDNDGNMDIVAGDKAGNIILYENSALDTIKLIPKTGDINDGEYGGSYGFTRDATNEIVSDSLTGLMWQDDSRVTENSKKWDELDMENDCKINLGGYSDWRFPNRYELYYLAQKGDIVLDSKFENISSFLKDYWTSSPNRIYVSFSRATSNKAIYTNYIRCVRGEALTFNFIRDDEQKVVLDKKHKLMWEDGLDSNLRTSSTGWDDAKILCNNLDYLNYSDWRLPNIHELYSIFDDNGFNKAFKNRNDLTDTLISSTAYAHSSTTKFPMFDSSEDKVYGIDVNSTLDIQVSISDSVKFRCVRDIP